MMNQTPINYHYRGKTIEARTERHTIWNVYKGTVRSRMERHYDVDGMRFYTLREAKHYVFESTQEVMQ